MVLACLHLRTKIIVVVLVINRIIIGAVARIQILNSIIVSGEEVKAATN